jgi:hypothetical protein
MNSIHRLVLVFLSFFLIVGASAQVYQGKMYEESSSKESLIILASTTVKKGEGCTQATKKTKFPLTQEQCLLVLEKGGRYPKEVMSPLMMPLIKDPVMYPGDQMNYVFSSTGNGWVLQSMY